MPASSRTTCSGRQLPRPRDQHQLEQPRRRAQHGGPVLHADGISRAFDIYYRTTTPLNSQGEYYQVVTPAPRSGSACRTATSTRCTTAPATSRRQINGNIRGMPLNYQIYIEEFGRNSNAVPLTLGWSRDERDSTITPMPAPLKRLNAEWSAGGDLRYLRLNAQYQLYIPITPVHLRLQHRVRLRHRGCRAERTRCSRTSSAAVSARCAASSRVARPDRRHRRLHRRHAPVQHQQRAPRRCQGRQRPHAAPVRLLAGHRQRLGLQRADHCPTACAHRAASA